MSLTFIKGESTNTPNRKGTNKPDMAEIYMCVCVYKDIYIYLVLLYIYPNIFENLYEMDQN